MTHCVSRSYTDRDVWFEDADFTEPWDSEYPCVVEKVSSCAFKGPRRPLNCIAAPASRLSYSSV